MDQISRTESNEKESENNNNNVNSLQACKVSKEQTQACKLQNLGTRIPSNIHGRFKKFVFDRYGKLNGVFSQEIARALEYYMNNQQQTSSLAYSSISKTGRPRSDSIEKHRQIAIKLKQMTNFPYVNHFTLIYQIKSVLGHCDKRTFNKYLDVIKKLSKEQITPFGIRPELDVSRYVEKIQRDDW